VLKEFIHKYRATQNEYNGLIVEPSFLDVLLSKMNPNNSNETAYIYKITYK